jgi:HNH endonuclease
VIGKPKVVPTPFAYPNGKHSRKHGPSGYKDYESYRDWLRDEFSFRCVFCLNREQWGLARGTWDIDHFIPQSRDSAGTLLYDNLLYVCRTCNSTKSSHLVPGPCDISFGDCLQVNGDGTVEALNEEGEILIDILRLDNEDYRRFRYLIIQTIQSLKRGDENAFVLWMSYPDNLPDLSSLRPPSNSRPDGIKDSFFALRTRGELDEIY